MDSKESDAGPFKIVTDSAFHQRSNDVFANLGHIEAKHNAYQKARSETTDGRNDKNLLKDDPNDEIVTVAKNEDKKSNAWKYTQPGFKRPRLPPPRSRRTPDHRLNPDKYTYYNLEDVSTETLSERSNTSAAMSFLDSVDRSNKKQKTDHAECMEVDRTDATDLLNSSAPKIIFNKPNRRSDDDDDDDVGRVGERQGCIIMPEYVVGQKPNKRNKTKHDKKKHCDSNAVKISHVLEDDDDDDDLLPTPTRTVFHDLADEGTKKADNDKPKKTSVRRGMRLQRDDESDEESEPLPSANDVLDLDALD